MTIHIFHKSAGSSVSHRRFTTIDFDCREFETDVSDSRRYKTNVVNPSDPRRHSRESSTLLTYATKLQKRWAGTHDWCRD